MFTTRTTSPDHETRPRRMRLRVGIAAMAAMALGLAGCGGGQSGSSGDSPDGTDGQPTTGGDATIFITQSIFSLDPAAIQTGNFGAGGAFLQALYDLLFYVDIDTNEVKGQLGKSIEPTNKDCSRWTMKLKPGLKFTDGTPLDAEAVVFNWNRIADPKTVSPQAPNMEGVTPTAADAQTVDIKLAEGNCAFDRTVAFSLGYIASPTAIEKEGKAFGQHPVGAGPFKLDRWDQGADSVTLTRNEDYLVDGQPYLDSVTIAQAGDPATIVDSIAAGEVQLVNGVSTPRAPDDAQDAGLGFQQLEPSGGQAYQFNLAKPPFDQLCARQAFAYALDPEQINEALNQSEVVGGPAYTVFDKSSEFYDESIRFPSADADKAAAAVEECESKNNPLDFSIAALAGTNDQKLAEYVASRLNQIDGFSVKVDTITAADAHSKIFVNRDFNVTAYPGGMRFHDPDPLFTDWLTSDGETNITGYASDEMDAAVRAADLARTPKERQAAYEKVQKIWTTDIPFWVYGQAPSYFIFEPTMTGVHPVNGGKDILLLQELGFTEGSQ